jgi:nucleotide-binding universal stress UspA family protein
MRFLQQELAKAIAARTSRPAHEVEIHVGRGEPVECIEQLAEQLGADLLCVGAAGKGTKERGLLGSVSQLVLRSSLIPVLIVP